MASCPNVPIWHSYLATHMYCVCGHPTNFTMYSYKILLVGVAVIAGVTATATPTSYSYTRRTPSGP